jgi:hypothetical protein
MNICLFAKSMTISKICLKLSAVLKQNTSFVCNYLLMGESSCSCGDSLAALVVPIGGHNRVPSPPLAVEKALALYVVCTTAEQSSKSRSMPPTTKLSSQQIAYTALIGYGSL